MKAAQLFQLPTQLELLFTTFGGHTLPLMQIDYKSN